MDDTRLSIEDLRRFLLGPPPAKQTIWTAPDDGEPYLICLSKAFVDEFFADEVMARIPVSEITLYPESRRIMLYSVYHTPYEDELGSRIHALREYLHRKARYDIDIAVRDVEAILRKQGWGGGEQ